MNLQEQINRIQQLMGIINEQISSNVNIPSKIYDAISAIESKYSFTDNGKIVGRQFSGKENDDLIKQYITDTIGADCWNKMDDKFKGQIYSFCFQADSSVPYKMKFVAGLANAIDSNIVRSTIVGKDLSDPNVKNAINVIKKACGAGNINSYYQKYLTILDQQYKSMDYNDNYQNVWKYRPIAVDKIMGGEDIDNVVKGWNGKNLPQQNNTNQQSTTPTTESYVVTVEQRKNAFNEIFNLVANNVREFVEENGNYNLVSCSTKLNGEDKIQVNFTLKSDPDGYNLGSIAFTDPSINNVVSKYNASVLFKDSITLTNDEVAGTYTYAFFGRNK